MKAGRTIGTAVVGFLFMLFVAVDLVLFGVVALDSAVITVLLAVGLVGGGVLGWLAAGRQAVPVTPAPADAAVPPPPPPPAPPPGPPPPPPPM
jgi:threonine/homoserine/homoserine lactone efflux protein